MNNDYTILKKENKYLEKNLKLSMIMKKKRILLKKLRFFIFS